LRGKYLDLKVSEDRRLLAILVAGYLIMLVIMCVFTFLAPGWASEGAV